jgi:hypothetical protein
MLKLDPIYVDTERDGKKVKDIILPNPYLCIGQDRQDIYYQDGKFYKGKDEEAIEYEDVPEWFWNILRTSYDYETIKKWGIVLPKGRVFTKEEIEAKAIEKANETWKCTYPECGVEIPARQKGIHIAVHKKKEYKAKRREERAQKEKAGV